jgi:hypothetical protein
VVIWKMTRAQWIVLPVAAILLGVVVAYLAYLWTQPDGDTVHGVVRVFAAADPTRPYTSGGCAPGNVGPGEYGDLQRGAVVKISDEAGQVLSVSGLSRGSDTLELCTFAFAAGPLDEAQTYTIQVAERHLGTYTRDELLARRWQVEFDLGSQTAQ